MPDPQIQFPGGGTDKTVLRLHPQLAADNGVADSLRFNLCCFRRDNPLPHNSFAKTRPWVDGWLCIT
jgi:hypothetical protein